MMEFLSPLRAYFELTIIYLVSGDLFYYSVIFIGIAFFFVLHQRDYRFTWRRRQIASVGTNLSLFWINAFISPVVILFVVRVQNGYDNLTIPSLDPVIWTAAWPWIVFIFVVFSFDFVNYWTHRIMHMSWLWPIHAIHHSEPELNILTPYRVHFLEGMLMKISYIFFLSWLGFPWSILAPAAVFAGLYNMYIHLGVDWGHGPFRLLLASPRFHRWHHADLPEAQGTNFANVFPFLDVLFGTYRVPGICTASLGAQGVPQNDVVKLCLFPFAEWTKMAWRLKTRISAS